MFKDGCIHVLHCYRVMLGKGFFSHKRVLFKNLCQNVCYILVLVYGLRKKKVSSNPSCTHNNHKQNFISYKGTQWINTRFYADHCHCECSHIHYGECRLITGQWMWHSFFQYNHIKVQIHKMKFPFMIYVTEFLNDCCVTWMQIYQFCCSAWQWSTNACPPTHAFLSAFMKPVLTQMHSVQKSA